MNIGSRNIRMVQTVAGGLGELLDDVVFVGGAITALYIEDEAARTLRPTEDVDCVVQIAKRKDYSDIEQKLRGLGFKHCAEDNAPICRWIFNGIKVDVMPNDPGILGFSNRWYGDGLKNTIKIRLPDGQKIAIFKLPLFVAAKIEAFHGRAESDYRISHDIEDIVTVLDGQIDFGKFYESPLPVSEYLKTQFNAFLADDLFIESISSHIEFDQQNKGRVKRLIDFLKTYTAGKDRSEP